MNTKKNQDKNYFKVPHQFEELYGHKYNPAEKYFYIMLRKLANRFKTKSGWFYHKDMEFISKKKQTLGFREYGFSIQMCIKMRKKFKEDNLIDYKYKYNSAGNRIGTEYKLIDNTIYNLSLTLKNNT